MKADVFKKLIKEAVREAVREELAVVLSEDNPSQNSTPQQVTRYQSYKPTASKSAATSTPLMEMLEMTKESMTSEDYRQMTSADTSMIQAPGLGRSSLAEHSFSTPEPGLDISQLDFVKKAGAVLKASQEKDKQRLGY